MTDAEPIILDTETWGQREFLEVICNRYFILGTEAIGDAAWQVNARLGEDLGANLISLNKHLEPLGFISLLDEGNPPILSVTHRPIDQVNIALWQQISIWILMFSFATLLGGLWIDVFESKTIVFSISVVLESIMNYSGPLFLILALAHYARVRVAAYFDVEIGNLIPIIFPVISPMWPFGVGGVFGQKRIDAAPIPNRYALGIIEFTTPLILFFSGMILTVAGLSLTPDQPPDYIVDPLSFQLNPLTDWIASSFISADLNIRLQWLHPLGLAGIGLSVVGWILLLPIPGLPGDRILQAIIGPEQVLSSEKQTGIFVFTLFLMVIIFATSDYWPWLILASLAAWRRFNGEHIPNPFIVNEAISIEDTQRNALVAIMAFVLLLGFPGSYPVYEITEWDGDLDTSLWPSELTGDDWLGQTLEFELAPDGILPVSGWIQVLVEGEANRWSLGSDCFVESHMCRFDSITQSNHISFNLTVDDLQSTNFSPVLLRFIVITDHSREEHVLTLRHFEVTAPASATWIKDDDLPNQKICTSIDVVENKTGNLSIHSNPFWILEGGSELSQGLHGVCLLAEEGGWESLEISFDSDVAGNRLGPMLMFDYDDGGTDYWVLPINDSYVQITSNPLHQILLETHSNTFYSESDGSPFCPAGDAIPLLDSTMNFNHTLVSGMPISLDGNYAGSSLILPESGWMITCGDSKPVAVIVESGFNIDIRGAAMMDSGLPLYDFIITSRENFTILISVESTNFLPSGEAFSIFTPTELEANGTALIEIDTIGGDDIERVLWVTADKEGIVIHLTSRCPLSGCS